MGFRDKMGSYYQEAYLQKYGDRLSGATGTVLSVNVETKSILGIFNKLIVSLVIKPETGKQIVKCKYRASKWFKKPTFIDVFQGNKVVIQGIKGEKGKADFDTITISNIANLTTRKDLHPFDHAQMKKARQQATKMRAR